MADSFIEVMNNQNLLQYSVTVQILIAIDCRGRLYSSVYLKDKPDRLIDRYNKFISSFALVHTMTQICLSNESIVDKVDDFLKRRTEPFSFKKAKESMDLFEEYLNQLHSDGIYDPKSKIPHDFPENAWMKSF